MFHTHDQNLNWLTITLHSLFFDVFRAHRCESFLRILCTHNIHQVFMPAGCTGELQPIDISVDEEFKAVMKSSFSRWYADEVKQALDQGVYMFP